MKVEAALPRFTTLDALRGVAAVLIVLYHMRVRGLAVSFSPPYAFLSVDLFFCLSGFVLAACYDHRFALGMSISQFMMIRAKRLLPLFILAWGVSFTAAGYSTLKPYGIATDLLNLAVLPGAENVFFPRNHPAWSLFLELWVANLLFSVLWRHLTWSNLTTLIAGSAIALILVERSFHDLNLGFSYETAVGGVARVIFSFFAGVAIARLHRQHPAPLNLPGILYIIALIVLLSLPWDGRGGAVVQLISVLFVFPIMIYFAASARERWSQVSFLLGEISYAAYILHWPILSLALSAPPHIRKSSVFGLSLLIAVIALSYLATKLLDLPVRRWLAKTNKSSVPSALT